MTEHPKLNLSDLPASLTAPRPVAELTSDELFDTADAVALLVEWAAESTIELSARRCALTAQGDQLQARQRDVDFEAHPAHCRDRRSVALAIEELRGDLRDHLERWNELGEQRESVNAVLDLASARWTEITAELDRREVR